MNLETLNPGLLLLIFIAGGVGSAIRLAFSRWSGRWPWGILVANVLASLVAGMAIGAFGGAATIAVVLVWGIAGGLSTFSSWAGQTVHLIGSGRWIAAVLYTAATVALSSTAVYIGLALVAR